MRTGLFIFTVLFMTIPSLTRAQEPPEESDVVVTTQFWTDFNAYHEKDERHSWSGQLGFRTITPNHWNKFVLVPTYNILNTKSPAFLNRKKKPLIYSYHLGGGLFYTKNKEEPNNMEFRLMQGLKFFLPSFEALPLKNYFRFEQRLQKTFSGGDWSLSARLRYKLSTVIEWDSKVFSFNEGLYIPLSIEFFYSLEEADRFNDVIRISPGLGYKLNNDWRGEFYISYHYSTNVSSVDDYSNEFVFRLRIFKSSSDVKAKLPKTKEEEMIELIE